MHVNRRTAAALAPLLYAPAQDDARVLLTFERVQLCDVEVLRVSAGRTRVQPTAEIGAHVLTIELVGANEAAIQSHMVGLDYVPLTPASAPEE